MRELHTLLTAVMFYTRIPVPVSFMFSNDLLNRATRYLPFIGLIVGGLSAGILWLLALWFPWPVAVILSLAFGVWLTGAFHEDGFADFCDGFGGGYTPEKVLDIMKDSRIGTFGAAGLLAMLATKTTALCSFEPQQACLYMVIAHMVSRFMPVIIIYTTDYVRLDLTSKVKPIGQRGSLGTFIIALTTALGALIWSPWPKTLIALLVLAGITFFFRRTIIKRIGGYTGDVLGALQQICELALYLIFLAEPK